MSFNESKLNNKFHHYQLYLQNKNKEDSVKLNIECFKELDKNIVESKTINQILIPSNDDSNQIIVALSFVGKLPSYTIECIHQIRIYFKGEVYLIIDDLNS